MQTSSPDTHPYDHVPGQLQTVRQHIEAVTRQAGRNPDDVHLVAVSKTHPVEAVLAALATGQTSFGENRVQEALEKFPLLRAAHPKLRLHIIGGLQTNKARDAVRVADVIETLDRPRLADALAEACVKEGRHPDLLIQVNTGDEPQKSGIPREQAAAFIAECQQRFGSQLTGLMCIPPAGEDPMPHFRQLTELARQFGLPVLSMGMSGDYETAIMAGATHVRVGTAIFGKRV